MTYDSTISFTLDTCCPWTMLAKRRLDEALRRFRESEDAGAVTFTVEYRPYQLYPEASQEGEDKYEWYKRSRIGDSEEKMEIKKLMKAYAGSCGIDLKFGGVFASTLDAHRMVQHYQNALGPETADKLINSLYSQYFENEKHPSSSETLLRAAKDAGIAEADARAFIEDRHAGLADVKMAIQEQKGNTDSVPTIVFEGHRRDITLVGAKDVEEYEKALQTIVKEAR